MRDGRDGTGCPAKLSFNDPEVCRRRRTGGPEVYRRRRTGGALTTHLGGASSAFLTDSHSRPYHGVLTSLAGALACGLTGLITS